MKQVKDSKSYWYRKIGTIILLLSKIMKIQAYLLTLSSDNVVPSDARQIFE